MSNSHNSYDVMVRAGCLQVMVWDASRRGSDSKKSNRSFDHGPQSLESVELEYQKDAIDLGRIRDKEEDEENHKHREAIRNVRENYMKKLAILRVEHAKQWEEFLQLEVLSGNSLQDNVHQPLGLAVTINRVIKSMRTQQAIHIILDPTCQWNQGEGIHILWITTIHQGHMTVTVTFNVRGVMILGKPIIDTRWVDWSFLWMQVGGVPRVHCDESESGQVMFGDHERC
ncbi:hypothetical protein HAX54_018880 [Datura stramonium]|uniref:Uncharacterized protein n=1 Tax=Datura stramonium TaxID=4076 RepID=A0ABS8RJX5_DATST|nr:hypothetical protein [Datura stramonium]